MKLLFGLLSSILSFFTISSQNLIIDPGFEDVDFVFDGKDTVYPYMHWKSMPFDTSATMDTLVLKYYQWVFKAESYIITNQPDSSVAAYLNAFRLKRPSFRDFRNARSGWKQMGTEDSTTIKEIVDLRNSSVLKNQELANQIDSISQLDQSVRTEKGGIGVQDSLNHIFVLNMYNNYVVSEETIGVNGMTNLGIVLLHLSRYPRFKDLIDKLWLEVLIGNMDNRTFANLVDTYYEYNISYSKTNSYYMTHSIFPVFSQFLFPNLDSDFINEIDKKRMVIGLEGIQDQYKKQFYNFKNGYREYEFYQFFNYFPSEEMCTEEEKKIYLEKEKILVEELMQKYENIVIWSK